MGKLETVEMTPFTDDDLRRLKEDFLDEPIHSAEELDKFFNEHGKALLARLEAAEACIRKAAFSLKYTSELEIWRKAAGK